MNIYIGNLSYQTSEDDLRSIFEEYGEVISAKIIMDRDSGRSKGFGFVEMSNDDEANEAIENLNEAEFRGRNMRVNKSEERKDRKGGGGRRDFNRNNNYRSNY